MTTGDIIPNADSSVAWSVTPAGAHEAVIDESKASPSMADAILATQIGGYHGAVDDFHTSTLSPITNVTQIQVYAYGITLDGGALVDLYNGSGWEGYQDIGIPTSTGWCSYTFTGLSMNQTNLNNCRVRFQASVSVSKATVNIGCVYAIVTYTYTPPGYGHDVNGVPAANIGSVNGVPTANILSVNGVS